MAFVATWFGLKSVWATRNGFWVNIALTQRVFRPPVGRAGVRLTVLVIALSAAAGCLGDRSTVERFETLPDGWTVEGGSWSVVNASTAGRVLSGRGDSDPGLSSFVNEELGALDDFDLEVSVGLLSGSDPQGAGIVLHWWDAGNYTIIRYSTHEHGWHLFTVIDGERTKQESATTSTQTDPGFNVWVGLHVIQENDHITAFDAETKVIDYNVPDGHATSGRVGLFVRGNSRAYFDDFRVTA